jgi:hypothetical protein
VGNGNAPVRMDPDLGFMGGREGVGWWGRMRRRLKSAFCARDWTETREG